MLRILRHKQENHENLIIQLKNFGKKQNACLAHEEAISKDAKRLSINKSLCLCER